jgi:hypothetical protein
MSTKNVGLCFYNFWGKCANNKCQLSHTLEAHHLLEEHLHVIDQLNSITGLEVAHCLYYFNGNCKNGAKCKFQHFVQKRMLAPREVQSLAEYNEKKSKKKMEKPQKSDSGALALIPVEKSVVVSQPKPSVESLAQSIEVCPLMCSLLSLTL